jgi:hypothetical protein
MNQFEFKGKRDVNGFKYPKIAIKGKCDRYGKNQRLYTLNVKKFCRTKRTKRKTKVLDLKKNKFFKHKLTKNSNCLLMKENDKKNILRMLGLLDTSNLCEIIHTWNIHSDPSFDQIKSVMNLLQLNLEPTYNKTVMLKSIYNKVHNKFKSKFQILINEYGEHEIIESAKFITLLLFNIISNDKNTNDKDEKLRKLIFNNNFTLN